MFNCFNNLSCSVYLEYLMCLNYWNINFLLFLLLLGVHCYNSYGARALILTPLTSITVFASPYISFFKVKQIVTTLLVGTITIHPLVFYSSLTLFILYVFSYKESCLFNKILIRKVSLIVALTLALGLGGLWGLQSNTWGYLWVNDGIEWLLVFIIFIILIYLHTYSTNLSKLYFGFFVFLTFNVLMLIRLNLITTRHSFLANYSSIYFIVFLYYSTILMLSFNFKVFKTIWHFPFDLGLYLGLVLTTFLTKNTSIYLKIFFYEVLNFFYKKIQTINYNFRIKFFHFFLVCFLFVWQIFYFYFFLNFSLVQLAGVSANYINSKTMSSLNSYSKLLNKDETLDQIVFKCNSINFYKFSQIKNSMAYYVFFNNSVYVYIFLVLFLVFLKMFELRFLHKKKTYFQKQGIFKKLLYCLS